MARSAKTVLERNRVGQLTDLVIIEFHDFITFGTMHVVVRRVAIVVFIRRSIVQTQFTEEICFDEQAKGAINGRSAYLAAREPEVGDKFVGIEMFMDIKDMPDQDTSWLRELLAANLKKLAEFLFRALVRGNRSQGPLV